MTHAGCVSTVRPVPKSKRILVLGSGGREHALARAFARSPSVADVLVVPGNAGTREQASAEHAPIRRLDGVLEANAVVALAAAERIDLVVVGPEAPLCAGVVNALEDAGIAAYGPRREAATLEGSKAFLKRFATRHGIPTAGYVIVRDMAEAEAAIRARGAPIVVKADGLCAGKGVIVAQTLDEALGAARSMLVERRFGEAGATVLVEDCVRGEEASLHAICDGKRLFVLPPARDHKRVGDGDTGANTGGMGVVAPSVNISHELVERITRTVLVPTLEGMRADGTPLKGTLFAGLMITPKGEPVLLEHNVRFGDPECEALTALVDGDWAEVCASAARGELDASSVRLAEDRHACVVVLAAAGYPSAPRTGDTIAGLAEAGQIEGVVIHHAGTTEREGRVVTAGGRVLAVTATARSAPEARARAYRAADIIDFEGKHFRRDIGGPLSLL